MKPIVLGTALLISAAASAQVNRVSLNLYTISGSKYSMNGAGTTQVADNHSLNLLPTIGYHRLIGKTTGIGLELGYNRMRYVSDLRQQTGAGRSTYARQETSSEEFFVSPGIFEVITSSNKRYRLIPYLNLPIGYTPELTNVSTTTQRASDGSFISSEFSSAVPQKQLRIGLQAGATAQIRVVGGFYAGISVGAGVTYYRQRVSGDAVSIYQPVVGPPTTFIQTIADNLSQSFGFGIQPQINLNYFF